MKGNRFKAALVNDVRFQYRYGFYLLYLVVSVVYAGILLAMPESWRPLAAGVILFSDPAALGLFFMGGIVLFEKSERTLDYLFVSPFSPGEYLWAKVLSLGVISTIAGLSIAAMAIPESTSPALLATGLFFGSVFFSLIGLALAGRVRSLNRFFLVVAPVSLVLWVPPFMVAGEVMQLWSLPGPAAIWELHPGAALLSVVLRATGAGGETASAKHLVTIAAWAALAMPLVLKEVRGMVKELGGAKL